MLPALTFFHIYPPAAEQRKALHETRASVKQLNPIYTVGLRNINMEPEQTMENMNQEKIVGDNVDETCVMDTEDMMISPSLMLSSSPASTIQSTDLPQELPSLRTKPLKISCDDSREHDNCLNSLTEDSPRTPKDAIFDPFASGPEGLLLAPFFRKCRTSTLNLGSSFKCNFTEQCESNAERIPENRLMEDAYDELLELAIMSTRVEEISVSDDRCTTPTSENHVHDDAEKCPDAPARTTENLKNTGKVSSKKKLDFNTAGLSRKLEF
ncbi:hypothetical protein POM88_021869 [Heracleum sosnowskyi]|uniref:Uncharacterized protein n=1 Tax=Heracleum sosnowskyi TaxID=360622 RepID=A0AAD8IFP7_9APIA|nr:hypothetical protein POM88_021869 [Heracleum sosnowskyi]